MTLKELKQNVEEEKQVIRELRVLISQRDIGSGRDKTLLDKSINSLAGLLKILNNSTPSLLENISVLKKLDGKVSEAPGLVNLKYTKGGVEKSVVINKQDKKKFFDELSLSQITLNRLKKHDKMTIVASEFKKPSAYAKISNRFFSKMSNRMIEKGNFKSVGVSLRKANIPFILNTYVSIIFFTTFLISVFSFFLFIFLIFFSISVTSPFISVAELGVQRLITNFLVCLALPVVGFFALYLYPNTEASSTGKKINQELPFVSMHMSAIAGSGIEPTQVFRIIATGTEYKHTREEIKKVINQVNIYGYDLVSALKNTARSTSSTKLAELLNGMATAISTGGSLTEFLDKRTETLLFDYKLERERSTKMAETFMNIYISVVIAAPLILMLLLILLSVGPISIGLCLDVLTVIIIAIVALINLFFIALLHLKQPVY